MREEIKKLEQARSELRQEVTQLQMQRGHMEEKLEHCRQAVHQTVSSIDRFYAGCHTGHAEAADVADAGKLVTQLMANLDNREVNVCESQQLFVGQENLVTGGTVGP